MDPAECECVSAACCGAIARVLDAPRELFGNPAPSRWSLRCTSKFHPFPLSGTAPFRCDAASPCPSWSAIHCTSTLLCFTGFRFLLIRLYVYLHLRVTFLCNVYLVSCIYSLWILFGVYLPHLYLRSSLPAATLPTQHTTSGPECVHTVIRLSGQPHRNGLSPGTATRGTTLCSEHVPGAL